MGVGRGLKEKHGEEKCLSGTDGANIQHVKPNELLRSYEKRMRHGLSLVVRYVGKVAPKSEDHVERADEYD
jgi:hypothetical protein